MKSEQFLKVLDSLMRQEKEILTTKGKEYAREDYGDDVHANFKRIAKAIGVSPLKVWAIYFMKHIDAILNFVHTETTYSSEPIQGRFMDARNYLALGFGILDDMEEAKEGIGLNKNPKHAALERAAAWMIKEDAHAGLFAEGIRKACAETDAKIKQMCQS